MSLRCNERTPRCDTLGSGTMATFLTYASYGNKPAFQHMDVSRKSCWSFLGPPPCLMHRRRQLAGPVPELTVMQLTHLIRELRQLRYQTGKESQETESRVCHTRGSSPSFQPKNTVTHCLFCLHHWKKQGG
ncbi:hypothetical protein XENTR_v10011723 [Xenopus tropicalis]|uniref:Uncharacterized protein LOC100493256 isoform X2 n=1 Tax=Xenopus tropicalis TaxID=8364 RepID=A0A8J0QKW8_XENTR|eukprot:XP_002931712.1 PREDICTED: uncharacterized protein LOC100493256 isoform X2 [Xenopus tropicalis]